MSAKVEQMDRRDAFKLEPNGIVWLNNEEATTAEQQSAAFLDANRRKLEELKRAREARAQAVEDGKKRKALI